MFTGSFNERSDASNAGVRKKHCTRTRKVHEKTIATSGSQDPTQGLDAMGLNDGALTDGTLAKGIFAAKVPS